MADATKTVILEFESRGNAGAELKDMLKTTRDLVAEQSKLNQLRMQGGNSASRAASSPMSPAFTAGNIPSAEGAASSQLTTALQGVQAQLAALNTKLGTRPAIGSTESAIEGDGATGGAPGARAAVGIGAFMLALHLGQQALEGFSRAGNAIQNSTLLTSQKIAAIGESIPVLGGVLRAASDFGGTAAGATESKRRLTAQTEINIAHIRDVGAANRSIDQLNAESIAAQNRATAFRANRVFVQGATARTTLAEQNAYEEEQHLRPASEAVSRSNKEVRAAEATVAALRAQSNIGKAEYDAERRNMPKIYGKAGHPEVESIEDYVRGRRLNPDNPRDERREAGPTPKEQTGGVNAFDKGMELYQVMKAGPQLEALAAIDEKRTRYQEQLNRLKEAEGALSQAQIKASQDQVEYARQELEILKQREAVAQANAQRLGGMSRVSRKRAVDALEQVERMGIEHAPEFLRRRAEQIAPKTLHNLYEQVGERSPEFARLQQLAPGEYRDKLQDVRQQVDKKQAEVGTMDRDNLAAGAQSIADNFGRHIGELVRMINEKVNDAVSKQIANDRFKNANGG